MAIWKKPEQEPSATQQFVQIPERASDPDHDPSGDAALYIKTGTGLQWWNGTAWASVDSSSASSTLDAIYNNNGNTVTVDNSDVVWNLAKASTNFKIANTLAATQASALEIDSAAASQVITDGILFSTSGSSATITDAIDASAADITNAINIGGNAIAGTNFSVDAAGAVTCVGATSTGAIDATGQTVTCATLSASTVTGVSALSLTALTVTGAIDFTTTETTSSAAYFDGTTITTGNVLRLEADNANMSTGYYINCTLDGGAEPGTNSKFKVEKDGATTIAGTAIGTTAFDITAGDAVLTSGDITITHGALSVSSTSARNSNLVSVNRYDSETNSIDGIQIDMGNAAIGGHALDIDFGTGAATGNAINVAYGGAATGDAVVINMTNAVGASAFDLTGAGTRTVPFVVITDVPADGAATFDINATPGHANGHIFDIDVAGVATSNVIDVAFAAAATGSVLNANMANAVSAQAINIDAAGFVGAANEGLVDIATSGSGNRAQYSNLLRISEAGSGTPAGATNGLCVYATDSSATAATSYAVYINSKNNEALYVDAGESLFDELITADGGLRVKDNDEIDFGDSGAEGFIKSDGTNIYLEPTSEFRIGSASATDYIGFTADGVVSLAGNAKPSKTISLGVNDFRVHTGSVQTDVIGTGVGVAWAFDKDSDEAISTSFIVPGDYDGGTISAYIMYTANATTGKVCWSIKTSSTVEGETLNAAGDEVTATDTVQGTAYLQSTTAAMTIGSTVAAGDLVQLKLTRDADNSSDTVTTDALFVGIKLVYTADSL